VPQVQLHKNGARHQGTVPDGANLVVLAGVRRFPFPHLAYGCGMGKCGKCACRVLAGGTDLPPPNWKETKILGAERLAAGERLMCQLWLDHDIELAQGATAAAA
jgi:ferredoxin